MQKAKRRQAALTAELERSKRTKQNRANEADTQKKAATTEDRREKKLKS